MHHRQHWTSTKIASRLRLIRPLVHRDARPLGAFRYRTLPDAETEPPVDPTLDDGDWERIEPQSYWGGWQTNFVMRARFTVPRAWADAAPEQALALHLPMGVAGDIFTHPEALLYIDGEPIASADRYHHLIRLDATLADGREHALALHGWTGLSGWPPDPHSRTRLFMDVCAQVLVDEPTERFVLLAALALDTANELDEDRPEHHRLLNALDAAFLVLDTRDPLRSGAFYDSVPRAHAVLEDGIRAAGSPLEARICAIGHAHMDIAYLWPIGQMRRKNARTSSNVLRLMDEHPCFRYATDQPQLYRYTEQDYPAIFARIRERIADGRWEPMGAMWVEPDCNIPSGEALVRQLVLGRRYFAERFGDLLPGLQQAARERGEPVPDSVDTPVLWLPDTFGFTFSLPQLLRQAGIRWFLTSKVNWNQSNPLPAQNLVWRGLDGSEVLTHVLTTPRPVQHLPFPTTYKAEVTPAELAGSWRNYRQKEAHDELLMVYGYGDGGGGPTRELVQQAAALDAMPGLPALTMGTVRGFFERLEASHRDPVARPLPVWHDEMYLEGHRGVLTSHGDIKRLNRRTERLLHRVEAVASLALALVGQPYPHEALRSAWERLCLNQFHDILPGTAIPVVFEDARRDFAALQAELQALYERAAAAIAFGVDDGAAAHADAAPLLAFNTAAAESSSVVVFEDLERFDALLARGEAILLAERQALADRAPASVLAAAPAPWQARAQAMSSSTGWSAPAAASDAAAPFGNAPGLEARPSHGDLPATNPPIARSRDPLPMAPGRADAGPGAALDPAAELAAAERCAEAMRERGCLPGELCRGTCAPCRRRACARLVDVVTGRPVRSQPVRGGVLLSLPPTPANSVTRVTLRHAADQVDERRVRGPVDAFAQQLDAGIRLSNGRLDVLIDRDGNVARVHDLEHDREVLAEGQVGNALQAFEDRPLNWDAWDIDPFFEERMERIEGLTRVEIVESGPLRAAVRIERRYRASTVQQTIRLNADSRRLDFVTHVDWQESHTLLKAAFPVRVMSPRATYEIQWGSIERATHRNTSWDRARFEVAAQQWADLSEGGYGVALLNDCKYGYDIRDNVMRLSLIKSATMPDPTSDRGDHLFTYSLYPHAGDWRCGVIGEARRLNDRAVLFASDGATRAPGTYLAGGAGSTDRSPVAPLAPGASFALVGCTARNAIIETIKAADDGRGYIVRLYEAERQRGPVRLQLGLEAMAVHRTDLLERDGEALPIEDRAVQLELAPFEIVSLRIVPTRQA